MSVRSALRKLRAAWVDADRKRHELEQRIASYNIPVSTSRERDDLDRALDRIRREGS